jgi:hypothetical protein
VIPKGIFTGLNIGTANASPGDQNFLPSAWPPARDFPICVAQDGTVTARFGDEEWDLTPWAGNVLKLNFGKPKRRDGGYIDPENSLIFRTVVAFWLYGPNPCKEIRTLKVQYENFRPIFVHCSKNKISASELSRFPKVIEGLALKISPSQSHRVITLLHNLWEGRETAGVYILDNEGIPALLSQLPDHEKSQTAYIPPRIWLYQLSRLRAFLDDFHSHRDEIQACAEYCLQAYAVCAGGLEEACSSQLKRSLRPFMSKSDHDRDGNSGVERFGSFYQTAENFGIAEILEKWAGDIRHHGVTLLAQYFSMATQVAKAYILNFTLMRIEEASKLRSDCLKIEADPVSGDDIYLLRGATSKTVEDDEACWISAPSSELAISVMQLVSAFRIKCAKLNRAIQLSDEDFANPYLELRPYEPWRRQVRFDNNPNVMTATYNYREFLSKFPRLFDETELLIRDDDIREAILVTPTLDSSKYVIGEPWPLAWHQLRRTGAVNMSASGIVGDASIQYQLKHLSRSMTRYYGSGYYHLDSSLNQEAQAEYIRVRYEMVARKFSSLIDNNFVSPHGAKRKDQITQLVSENDHKQLLSAAKNGTIIYREIILGACANSKPCPYGGFDYVAKCGGGDGSPACRDLLIDKSRRSRIVKLGELLRQRLRNVASDTPLYQSITYQLQAVEKTIHVIDNL